MKTNKKIIWLKRAFDILFSLFGIVFCILFLWWWIILINLFATKFHPLLFQERLGEKKKIFKIIKFRTLKVGCPNIPPFELDTAIIRNHETFFGKFLRKTSLDETLQLFNVLAGQMSLVGPRPGLAKGEENLIEERERYSPNAFSVKPGLTGFAQVMMNKGHNPIEKARYDYEYVNNLSLRLDFKILIKTFFHNVKI